MSQGMDPYLAELYNTNGHAEKVAYVQNVTGAFIKQAEEEGYDLSNIDEDTLVEAALQWAEDIENGDDGEGEYDPEYVEGPGNLGPKHAEVDFLGRAMAHAYNDELQKISGAWSEAGKAVKGAIGGTARKVHEKILGLGQKLHRKGSLTEKAVSAATGKKKELLARMRAGGMKPIEIQNVLKSTEPGKGGIEIGRAMMSAGEKAQRRSKALRGYGALGGGAALVGGGAYGASKLMGKKEKKSHLEILDEAAIDRANELLKIASEGYDVDFESVAETDENDFDRAITELAWEKLRDEGYIE